MGPRISIQKCVYLECKKTAFLYIFQKGCHSVLRFLSFPSTVTSVYMSDIYQESPSVPSVKHFMCGFLHRLELGNDLHYIKKVLRFTNSRAGRVCVIDMPAEDRKIANFFYSVGRYSLCYPFISGINNGRL
jgi:hypothetical protein